jgi:hypothetical protein
MNNIASDKTKMTLSIIEQKMLLYSSLTRRHSSLYLSRGSSKLSNYSTFARGNSGSQLYYERLLRQAHKEAVPALANK